MFTMGSYFFKKFIFIMSFLLIVFILFPLISEAGTVICRAIKIEGFDHCYNKALKVIGNETTSDMNQAKIFIFWEKNESLWYIHSNFITPPKEKGYYPTKVATNETNDIEMITQNIIFDFENQPDEKEVIQFWDAYNYHIKFIVDAPIENFKN